MVLPDNALRPTTLLFRIVTGLLSNLPVERNGRKSPSCPVEEISAVNGLPPAGTMHQSRRMQPVNQAALGVNFARSPKAVLKDQKYRLDDRTIHIDCILLDEGC